MDDYLSTRQVGWLIGKSAGSVRRMITDGEIPGMRIPGAFRIPRDEVIRLARDTLEAEAGRKLSDTELERLVDRVIATNEERAGPA